MHNQQNDGMSRHSAVCASGPCLPNEPHATSHAASLNVLASVEVYLKLTAILLSGSCQGLDIHMHCCNIALL